MMLLTPPVEIAAWLACLTFVVMLFNHLSRAWFTLRGKPTPIEQQEATQAISERVMRIETCYLNQDRRLEALEVDSGRMRDLLRTEMKIVSDRINAVADTVANNDGQLTLIQRQLASLLERNLR